MSINKKLKIAVLPGDGIGKDVTLSAIPVFHALDIPVEIVFGDIGWEFWKQEGTPVPDRTWELINSSDATLLGAITSKPEREAMKELTPLLRQSNPKYVSPVIQLRQKMDLYANVRPCFNIKGEIDDFNFCVIRENTEGLYAGFDFYPLPEQLKSLIDEKSHWQKLSKEEISCSLRLQSKNGLTRLFEFAFNYANSENMSRVTFADKPNVLRKSSAFSREIFEEISKKHPHIQADILNVDAVALWLVRRPEEFGVIVAENMFGDILSDLGAGVMGGLGFAPSANIGEKGCYFEPVHGSAPRINSNFANPCAMFLTISLLLKHFGYQNQANSIKQAIQDVIKEKNYLTYDLGGKASTEDMAKAIIDHCLNPRQQKTIAFLATGNEIIDGDIQDGNSHHFAQIITEHGGTVYQHTQVSDNKFEITSALKNLLNESDAVVITGGLGPTSDDNTRYAISDAIKKDLYFDEVAWDHIVNRLTKFNLIVTDSNRQQALFPENAELYPNENGTAFGCHLHWKGKHIFMLPGPPKECYPMFEKHVLAVLEKSDFFIKKKTYRWLTIGLIEGEIAPKIDALATSHAFRTAYRWSYPYLEIKVTSNQNINSTDLIEKIESELHPNLISRNGQNAYEVLNHALPLFPDNVYVIGNEVVEQFINEINHPHLIFLGESQQKEPHSIKFQLKMLKTKDNENIIDLESYGCIQEKIKYEHRMSVPNRGSEVIFYIKNYLAWQLYQFSKFCGWTK